MRAAGHLASSGASWYEIVKAHNSGTYNNQVTCIISSCLMSIVHCLVRHHSLLMVCMFVRIMLQYMILDGNKFKPGNALPEEALYVVEQIPGLVVGGDATNELEKGYWSSYNGEIMDVYV